MLRQLPAEEKFVDLSYGIYGDIPGSGLFLFVMKRGIFFKFRGRLNGGKFKRTLGRWPDMTVEQARIVAAFWKADLRERKRIAYRTKGTSDAHP